MHLYLLKQYLFGGIRTSCLNSRLIYLIYYFNPVSARYAIHIHEKIIKLQLMHAQPKERLKISIKAAFQIQVHVQMWLWLWLINNARCPKG